MFGELRDVVNALADIQRTMAKMVDMLQRIDDHLAMLPICECGAHVNVGETWLCPLHGWVTKATYSISK